MELIPIFSLIVLVATIGTFILAVGAYIMFRYRESRSGAPPARGAATFEADVFAPQPVEAQPSEGVPASVARRELPRDPRVMQFQPDPYGPAEGPAADDRRRWR